MGEIMCLSGKKIRLGHIFRDDGKTFVVTMDHGVDLGPVEGLEDIKSTLKNVLKCDYKPDAILMNPSMIRLCHEDLAGKVGVIARLDGTATLLGPDMTDYRLFSSVEDALRCGADAVATMAFIGVKRESENSEKIGKVSQECNKWGMPHFVESLPPEIIDYYFKPKAERRWADPEHVKFADRVAAELGADVVKSYYTGDPDTFREVVRSCPVPIIVASGPMASDPEGLLRMVNEVMEAGAKGVIMGRNIWGYENMPAIMEAISKIVHEEESLERAIKIIK
ncbi:fructose-bisphosphate aldolase [Candidatus Bathyarchaeota archaeon]|nr:MAG: fructose-bisphosphate aldolase [Candidatus Bathyarchaeota archaeon]